MYIHQIQKKHLFRSPRRLHTQIDSFLTSGVTREVVESSSLIDVILTNKSRSVLTSGVFDLGLSGHAHSYLHCYVVTMSKHQS